MSAFSAVFRFELASARRSRILLGFALGFLAATMVVALVGLAAGGALALQGFTRTSMSLLQVVLWVIPALALLLGAGLGADSYELEFVVALPAGRRQVLWARYAAWLVALGAALLLGLGGAGLVIASLAGGADLWRYLRLLGLSEALLALTLGLGVLLGVYARNRTRALGLAVLAWFVLVVGMDLAAMGLLTMLPRGEAGWGLSILLLANPVDTVRSLALALLQADSVAGPTGAALRKVLGGAGLPALAAGLAVWVVMPLVLAGRRFASSDL